MYHTSARQAGFIYRLPFHLKVKKSPKRSESRIPVVLPRGVSVETFFRVKNGPSFPAVGCQTTRPIRLPQSWADWIHGWYCLVVLAVPILKNDGVKVNGKDDYPTMEKKCLKHHEPWFIGFTADEKNDKLLSWSTSAHLFETSPFRKKNKDPALQVCPKGSLCLIAWQGAYFHTCHMCHKGRCRKVKSCQIYIQIPFIFPVF